MENQSGLFTVIKTVYICLDNYVSPGPPESLKEKYGYTPKKVFERIRNHYNIGDEDKLK